MGDYTHMRGTVKIKPELVVALMPFFNWKEDEEENTDPDAGNWTFAKAPDSVKELVGYKLLCHNNIGHWTPWAVSAISPWENGGHCHLNEEGTLTFQCGYKNYNSQQEAFLTLLPELATEWNIEQDWTDCMMFRNYTDGEGITVYSHTDAPEVMTELLERVQRKYLNLTAEKKVRKTELSPVFAAPYKGKTDDVVIVGAGASLYNSMQNAAHNYPTMIIDSVPDRFADFERKLLSPDVHLYQHSQTPYAGYNPSPTRGKTKRNVKAKRKQQAQSRKKNRR